MKKSRSILLTLIVLFTFACGTSNTQQSHPNPPQLYSAFSLLGKWQNACLLVGKSNSVQTQFLVTDPQLLRNVSYYNGTTCAANKIQYTYSYAHEQPRSEDSELEGYSTLIQITRSISLKIQDPTFLREFNADARFGYSDWELNSYKAVEGRKFSKNSKPLLEIGSISSLTLQIEKNQIQLASTSGGKLGISASPALVFHKIKE